MPETSVSLTMVGVDPSCLGGIATLARDLCARIESDDAIDFEYIASSNQSSALGKMLLFAKALFRLRERMESVHSANHIVHIHMADNASVVRSCAVLRLVKKYNARTLIHVHCDLGKIYRASSPKMRLLIEYALKNCDGIISLGNYMEGFLLSLGKEKNDLFVLPNAVSCPVSNPYNRSSKRVLFLGNVSREKGVVDLLDALVLARESLPEDCGVDICGRDLIDIEELLREKGLCGFVKYRGVVMPDSDFFHEYGLHVLPSYKEALPFALLETSAHGIPSVVTNAGSMAEVVDSGRSGFVVDIADVRAISERIVLLLCDAALRSRMSNAAFSKVKAAYSMDAYVIELGGIYERLLDV